MAGYFNKFIKKYPKFLNSKTPQYTFSKIPNPSERFMVKNFHNTATVKFLKKKSLETPNQYEVLI